MFKQQTFLGEQNCNSNIGVILQNDFFALLCIIKNWSENKMEAKLIIQYKLKVRSGWKKKKKKRLEKQCIRTVYYMDKTAHREHQVYMYTMVQREEVKGIACSRRWLTLVRSSKLAQISLTRRILYIVYIVYMYGAYTPSPATNSAKYVTWFWPSLWIFV